MKLKNLYTYEAFKKFQNEVSEAAACFSLTQKENGMIKVQDFEKNAKLMIVGMKDNNIYLFISNVEY